jgi:hypothetical protein
MLDPNKFNEEDKSKLIEFLNMVALHGEFKLSTNQIIQYFKLLSFIQQKLIPKIEANILEVKAIVETPKNSDSQEHKG